jgi:GNAT superfamily N-acetyltransferase
MRFNEFVIEYREPKSKRAHRDGIDLEAFGSNGEFQINAEAHGRQLGQVLFDINGKTLVAKDLQVFPEYRGQGIAAIMYDWAKELGYTVQRSGEQTDDGKQFWDKNRGEDETVWEDLVDEVTMVNTQSKNKRQHLDVLPNDGKPIPPGEESDYLGNLIAEMDNNLQLWSWTSHGTVTYYVFDTNARTAQLGTTGRPYTTNRDSFVIQGTYSGPKNRMRAADLYAFLILNRGLTLVSDNKQSEGGYRVWQELERRYGRRLNIHGFDTKTNQPVNVTTQDEPDTHVSRADVKQAGPQMKKELASISRDLRFVASAR